MSVDRRDFLTHLGVSSSAAVLAGFYPDPALAIVATNSDDDGLVWDKAPCRFCGTGCGVEVGVRDGEVKAVRGDERSPVNKGLLCVKGYHLPAILYGRDRLKFPLRRKADGSGYEQISWDAALDLIAEKFSTTLKEQGPDAVAMYGSGQWTVFDGYAALKWVKAGMRSNNIDPNARLCMASA
ncbi:MAG: molybdopterin-dependent oxidoreductase, partial [Planctomycetes bacterium]|nr:molybdopterin-dependent oxidoreductase [Planctomycetota bacterium]